MAPFSAIVFELPAFLCADVISTCVCLRLREQCLRSEITSVARVAHVLLLRPISGNMDVNALASKRSELIGNAEIVRMHLSVAAITQKRKLRPVAGLRRIIIIIIDISWQEVGPTRVPTQKYWSGRPAPVCGAYTYTDKPTPFAMAWPCPSNG